MNLDYNIILISHEDKSKDITKKTGDKITAIKPNINDKVALKLAGMVDIVARIINDNGERTISFKSNEVVFGGGRLQINKLDIPCDYNELMKVYESSGIKESLTTEKPAEETKESVSEDLRSEVETENKEPEEQQSVRRTRRVRNTEETKEEMPIF